MKSKQARELAQRVARLVQAGEIAQAYALLSPVLAQRTPFAMLRHVGEAVGVGPLETANVFMDRVAAEKTEGGWLCDTHLFPISSHFISSVFSHPDIYLSIFMMKDRLLNENEFMYK